MKYRILGRTGLSVSEIGFGAWGIGQGEWKGADDTTAASCLRLAYEKGINFFDTALVYGGGRSEKLIGTLAKDLGRDKVILASKVPPKNMKWPAECGAKVHELFPAPYIIECVEQSLKNLGTDHIDLMQLHVWQDHWLEESEWQDAMLSLKKAGKVRFWGVSVNDHDPTSALLLCQHSIADVLQVIYNIYDPTAEEALFELAKEKHLGIIARVPFDEGALTGTIHSNTEFPQGDFRNLYFKDDRKKQVEMRARSLQSLLGTECSNLPELALRFCLSNDVVSTVIPGMRKTQHVEANASISNGTKLSPNLLSELTKHAWPKNFYEDLH